MDGKFVVPFDAVSRLRNRSREFLVDRDRIADVAIGLRDIYARTVVSFARLRNRYRHPAPIDPYRIYWVDPSSITRSMSWDRLSEPQALQLDERFQRPQYRLAGRVMAGDWDLGHDPFEASVIFTSFRAHFVDDVPWEETKLFYQCWQAIKRDERPWGCSTLEACYRRFEALDQLFRAIDRHGYRTQTEIIDQHRFDPLDSARSNAYSRIIEGEIAVNVGRTGELLFYDGRHRLAIAKLLGVDEIPIIILTRHRRWQELRDGIVRGEVRRVDPPGSYHDHPDLVDLVDGG